MHEVLVNRLRGLSLPRKSVVRLTDRPDMTSDVYRGRKTTIQQQQQYPAVVYNKPYSTGSRVNSLGHFLTVSRTPEKVVLDGNSEIFNILFHNESICCDP